MSKSRSHERVNDILLGPLERPALAWLAKNMPPWVTPDILTFIGVIGSIVIIVGYTLTNRHELFFWLASAGFLVNWFGDSLDGTLARYRKIERPRYGFFVDHTVDAFSQLLIFGGLGLTPHVSFNVAMLALAGYLLMSVYVYVDTYVTGQFKISYGKFGPTEMRVIGVLANTTFLILGKPFVNTGFGSIVLYDIVVFVIALIMIVIFTISTVRRAAELAGMGE